jgi:hypothetical protein
MYSLAYLFPHLFPVDDPQTAMKAFCVERQSAPLASEIAEMELPAEDVEEFQFA